MRRPKPPCFSSSWKNPLRIIQQTHDLEIHCQKIDYISIISGKTEYIERGIVSLISICCTLSNGNRLIFPPSQPGWGPASTSWCVFIYLHMKTWQLSELSPFQQWNQRWWRHACPPVPLLDDHTDGLFLLVAPANDPSSNSSINHNHKRQVSSSRLQ